MRRIFWSTRTEKVAEPQRRQKPTPTKSFFSSKHHRLAPTATVTEKEREKEEEGFWDLIVALRFFVFGFYYISSSHSPIMTGRGGGAARKTLLSPIHYIFRLLQTRQTVSIWLYEQLAFRIEGKIRVSCSGAWASWSAVAGLNH